MSDSLYPWPHNNVYESWKFGEDRSSTSEIIGLIEEKDTELEMRGKA